MSMSGHRMRLMASANKSGGASIVVRFAAGSAVVIFPASGVAGSWSWGDGSAPVVNASGTLSKTVPATTATFTGTISGGDVLITGPATHVDDWIEGPTRYYFQNSSALLAVPTFLPRSVTSAFQMFNGATSFNSPLPWDTSKITNMNSMFLSASSFNQDLSGWCVTAFPTKPTSFDNDTPAWVKAGRQPIWGTCP